MARDISKHPRQTRRAMRRAAAVALAFCLLSLASIPSATAKRNRVPPASAPVEAGVLQEPVLEAAPVTHPRRHSTVEASLPASEEALVTPPIKTKRVAGNPAPRRGPAHPRRSTTPVSPPGEAEAPAGEAQPAAAPAVTVTEKKGGKQKGSQGEKGHGRGHEEKPERTHKKKPKPGKPTTPVQTEHAPTVVTPAPAPAPEPTASVASVAAVSAPVAAPPVATLAALSSASQPASPGRRGAAARRLPARAASSSVRRSTALPAALAASALPVPAKRAATAPAGSRPTVRVVRSSPLVRTITRIADVVPTPIRVLIIGLLGLALALAVRSRFADVRTRRLSRQRQQLLEDVGLLQAALLPVPPQRIGPVGTSVAYQPAAGPGAGGDFYDVFALADGQLAVIVGDVSGHGRQALPHTALVRFTLRAYLEAGLAPRDAVRMAGAVLDSQLGGSFATVVAATYQPRDRLLVYSCAGHPPPVVLGCAPGSMPVAQITACSSPPIGVGMRTGTRQTVISIPGGAQVCFFTDGVTEARIGSELFGSERLADTLTEIGPQATAAMVIERVLERSDAHPDDMAACLLRIEGDEQSPTALAELLEVDREEASSARTRRFLRCCGVERDSVSDVVNEAGAGAGSAGTVVIELHSSDGPPQVTVRGGDVALLDERRARVAVAR